MKPFRKVIPGALLIMVLAGLSACGKNATPVGTSSPAAPSAPTAAAAAPPSPTAAAPAKGVLTCGIGIAWPVSHSNPQLAVRATEVEKVTNHGQHRYIVAIDVDASSAGSQH
jgi:hypothetical protein